MGCGLIQPRSRCLAGSTSTCWAVSWALGSQLINLFLYQPCLSVSATLISMTVASALACLEQPQQETSCLGLKYLAEMILRVESKIATVACKALCGLLPPSGSHLFNPLDFFHLLLSHSCLQHNHCLHTSDVLLPQDLCTQCYLSSATFT